MEAYCVRDVDISSLLFNLFTPILSDATQTAAIRLEHSFQLVCNDLHNNGFGFNTTKAKSLLEKMEEEIIKLDKSIAEFPPVFKLIRKFTPRATKWGTINQTSVPKSLRSNISEYVVGREYDYGVSEPFNPNSIKQTVDLLWDAGWKPIDKTKTHLRNKELDKEEKLSKYGWKINETNLATLPTKAPAAAKTLARRILYESRRRTLKEWLNLVQDGGRIHGKFQGIGAWTHRMAHQAPNMANIPNEKNLDGTPKLLGGEMRALFVAPKNRLLVGTDAKGIQLRIFAHYINDAEFTDAVSNGDPHTLNKNIMGELCKTRAAAKRFIFAMLLGAGLGKLAEILECSREQAGEALHRIMERYDGFRILKETVIPKDASQGYFTGLDGRKVRIPGDSESKRRHLAMSGYLQNGEAVVMKRATLKWLNSLAAHLEDNNYRFASTLPLYKLVNLVHDEWQTECTNNMEVATLIGRLQHEALVEVGEELKLHCPLAGSYQRDDGEYTIGTNWKITH
jgi:DNA polymerase-1